MNNNTFSTKDLYTMSEGIIALIGQASQAQKFVATDENSRKAIEEYITYLQGLNSRICNEIGKIEVGYYDEEGYGYGEVKYETPDDFPDTIMYQGKKWYYSGCDGKTINTGMLTMKYYADPEDYSQGVWMDAAGNFAKD